MISLMYFLKHQSGHCVAKLAWL